MISKNAFAKIQSESQQLYATPNPANNNDNSNNSQEEPYVLIYS